MVLRTKKAIIDVLISHKCNNCESIFLVFQNVSDDIRKNNKKWMAAMRSNQDKMNDYKTRKKNENDQTYNKKKLFPPKPPSRKLLHKIISGYCNETSPVMFQEAGCAVCGRLTPIKDLCIKLKDMEFNKSLLASNGCTRQVRNNSKDNIEEIEGTVLAPLCDSVCRSCKIQLEDGKTPKMALANGLWLGDIPPELQNLTYMERLMIAKVRHSFCVVKADSRRYKLKANVICFSNPIAKVYRELPPSKQDIDEMIAFQFTGLCQPTPEDLKRTPLFARLHKVRIALEWLQLNHADYVDVTISNENINSYKDDEGVFVSCDYEKVDSETIDPLTTSVHGNDIFEGTSEGPCPFMVHGLTGEQFSNMNKTQVKAAALKHLKSNGKILYIGHNEKPQDTFYNPELFPSMFPHLFPFGLGGIQNSRHIVSDDKLK